MVSVGREQMAVALIEHDVNDDMLCVWNYPDVPIPLQNLIIKRIGSEGQQQSFFYFKIKSEWIYVASTPAIKGITPDVTTLYMSLASKVFNPEKYRDMLEVFLNQYKSSGDPTQILEAYLSIFTTGKYSGNGKSIDTAKYPDNKAIIAESAMKDIVTTLGMDAVILWNAVLLKKRVLIYSDNLPKLLSVVRTLPQLVWHRQDCSILRPIVSQDKEHVEDLNSSGVFIAGTLDATLLPSQSGLFDVIYSLSERQVSVADHAKEDMRMGATHRDIAQIFTSGAASTDQDIIKALAAKTTQIVNNLKSLAAEDGKLSKDIIRSNVSNEFMQQWLVRLAIAEGMM